MYTVSESIEFSYGHRLMDYEGKCRNLHGHNGRAEILLRAEALDARSMVEDFDRIGEVVRGWIAETIDHKTILRRDDPLVPLLGQAGEPVVVLEMNPTAEAIARLIFDAAKERGLPVVEVKLWETSGSVASYSSSW